VKKTIPHSTPLDHGRMPCPVRLTTNGAAPNPPPVMRTYVAWNPPQSPLFYRGGEGERSEQGGWLCVAPPSTYPTVETQNVVPLHALIQETSLRKNPSAIKQPIAITNPRNTGCETRYASAAPAYPPTTAIPPSSSRCPPTIAPPDA